MSIILTKMSPITLKKGSFLVGIVIFILILFTFINKDNLEFLAFSNYLCRLISDWIVLIFFIYIVSTLKENLIERRVWIFLTLAMLFLTLGNMVSIWTLLYSSWQLISLATVFYIITYLSYASGILFFPGSALKPINRAKMFLDLAIFVTLLTIFVWSFIVSPLIINQPEITLLMAFTLLSSTFYFFTLIISIDSIFNRSEKDLPASLLFLALAVIVFMMTNLFTLILEINGNYTQGSFFDIGWILGTLIVLLAGLAQINQNKLTIPQFLHVHFPLQHKYKFDIILPLLWIFSVFIILIWSQMFKIPIESSLIIFGASFIVLMVVIRQILAYNENKKLYLESQKEISRRIEIEKELKSSLAEKDVLFKEIHHRVKNNLQIISSMLNLQIQFENSDEITNILKESQGRIKSMAMVHERLYQSNNLSNINLKDYLTRLVSDIFYSYSISLRNVELQLDINDVNIGIDTAIPLGLIINELVTNSVKYAFPDGKKGIIKIVFKLKQHNYILVVFDDGVGIPVDIEPQKSTTLGLQLVSRLINQLDGFMELDRSMGTKYVITFPEVIYKERI